VSFAPTGPAGCAITRHDWARSPSGLLPKPSARPVRGRKDFSVKTGVMLGLGAYDDSPSVEGESPAPANAEAAFSPARFEGDGEVAADGGAQRARGAGDLHARRAPPLG